MSTYIDGFVFPLRKADIEAYQVVAKKVASIWKEYGALSYSEFVGDDLQLEGVQSFTDAINATADEVIVFGWVSFPNKQVRDDANKKVPQDSRMHELVAPLTSTERMIFDARRMVYGGFKALVVED